MNNNIEPKTIEQGLRDLPVTSEVPVSATEVVGSSPSDIPSELPQDILSIASGADAIAQANIPVSDTRIPLQELNSSIPPTSFRGILDRKRGGASISVGYK
ncbi:hypothetical protein K8R20_03300 [bacterium]|nr:hypothetical protein [bacterium]